MTTEYTEDQVLQGVLGNINDPAIVMTQEQVQEFLEYIESDELTLEHFDANKDSWEFVMRELQCLSNEFDRLNDPGFLYACRLDDMHDTQIMYALGK